MQTIFIGVDGGATKCIVRVEDEHGDLLGRVMSGPANLRISVTDSWQSIYAGLNKILAMHAISLTSSEYRFYVGMGLAGLEIEEAYQAFLKEAHGFHTLVVATDAHTACLGAHGGEDGAVIIAGTGVVGFQIEQGETAKVSGYGFPHDDIGGGAWLGLQAIQVTLQWLDGRLPLSGLASAIYDYFQQDMSKMVSWSNHANSTLFASLAPIVLEQSQQGDMTAISLLHQAAASIDRIGSALVKRQKGSSILPCALSGSITPFLLPYLTSELRTRIRPMIDTADAGAIFLVRQYFNQSPSRVSG